MTEPETDAAATMRINGVDYDIEDLTLDEVEYVEDTCGAPLDELNFTSAKVLKAFAFVFMRRDEPDLTPEDIGKLKYVPLMRGLGNEGEANGDPPANRAERRASARAKPATSGRRS